MIEKLKNCLKGFHQKKGHKQRWGLANTYLKAGWTGIEIGALHQPLRLPEQCKVKFVDRLSVDDLRAHYPELALLPLVSVDIIDDGETLKTFENESVDFIIANHFIEHCQDPIGTLIRFSNVIRQDGILYLAVPDKRFTFDCDRAVTSLEHLILDYKKGPHNSYTDHLRDYAKNVDKLDSEALEARVRFLENTKYSIHFHVWTQKEILELVTYLQKEIRIPFRLEKHSFNRALAENILILRKT